MYNILILYMRRPRSHANSYFKNNLLTCPDNNKEGGSILYFIKLGETAYNVQPRSSTFNTQHNAQHYTTLHTLTYC